MAIRGHTVCQEEAIWLKIEARLDMIQETFQWTILKATRVAREFIQLALGKHHR